ILREVSDRCSHQPLVATPSYGEQIQLNPFPQQERGRRIGSHSPYWGAHELPRLATVRSLPQHVPTILIDGPCRLADPDEPRKAAVDRRPRESLVDAHLNAEIPGDVNGRRRRSGIERHIANSLRLARDLVPASPAILARPEAPAVGATGVPIKQVRASVRFRINHDRAHKNPGGQS